MGPIRGKTGRATQAARFGRWDIAALALLSLTLAPAGLRAQQADGGWRQSGPYFEQPAPVPRYGQQDYAQSSPYGQQPYAQTAPDAIQQRDIGGRERVRSNRLHVGHGAHPARRNTAASPSATSRREGITNKSLVIRNRDIITFLAVNGFGRFDPSA